MSTNHNLFEEKGETKRIRTEVPLLISLTPDRKAQPGHGLLDDQFRPDEHLLLEQTAAQTA